MLIFKKIRYKNFISTGNQWIELDLNKTKTTILFGKNGSGKSTFTDAITYALYGKPFRKINKPQLVNNYNRGDMVCEIEFEVGGKDYKVIRGQKPAIFEIYENGKLINQDSSSYDYQDYLINHILKINYKSFIQIIVVGSATYVPFMQLLPNFRRAVVEDLLNIDIISKMNIALKRKLADHSILINEISKKYEIASEKLKIHNEYMKTNLDSLSKNISDIEAQLLDQETKIQAKEAEVVSVTQELDKLLEKREKSKKILDVQAFLTKTISDTNNKIKAIEVSKAFFEKEAKCSKCLQPIAHEHKEHILTEKNSELEKLRLLLSETQEQYNKTKPKVEEYIKLEDDIKNMQSAKMKLEIEKDSLVKYAKNLKTTLLDALNKKEEALKRLKENISEMKTELDFLSKEKSSLLYTGAVYDTVQSMLRDDGIKTRIIKYYLPTMNKLINKYLSYMNFKIGFELNENFEETIHNAAKRDFTYENFSEGEKLRIDLAILFAWRELSKIKTNTNTNLLIMDEILDSSLDAEGTDDFIRIIKTIIDDKGNNVFIISHKDEQIIDKFHRAIKFEKPDGRFTRVVELAN